jgi:hypothetical protein
MAHNAQTGADGLRGSQFARDRHYQHSIAQVHYRFRGGLGCVVIASIDQPVASREQYRPFGHSVRGGHRFLLVVLLQMLVADYKPVQPHLPSIILADDLQPVGVTGSN